MGPRSLIVSFLWRFALVYGLLIAPWPGFTAAYGRYFRALGQTVFSRERDPRILYFEAVPGNLHHVLDTRIVLANRDQIDREGRGPVRYLELDTRGVGWVPTALTVAFILATPVSWRRRRRALLSGVLMVHGFILFSVAVLVWNNLTELSLISLTPFWKQILAGLEETLITQLGASFVAPVLIWTLVVVRRQNVIEWRGYGEKQDDRVESRPAGIES